MRKLNLSLIAALAAAVTFVSCGNDDNPNDPNDIAPASGLVTFEDAQLPAEGYLVDHTHIEKGLTFQHNYTESEYGGYWNGFAVSRNTDTDTPGYGNMYSVYGNGGAAGSEKFAVAYVSDTSDIVFAGSSERFIEYAYVTNGTYAALSMRNGDGEGGFARQFAEGDWFLLTITGYNAKGAKTNDKKVYLADYTDGKSDIMDEWTKIELTDLGKVHTVKFSLSSTDNGDYGMNTPAVFCIDNISYTTTVSAD